MCVGATPPRAATHCFEVQADQPGAQSESRLAYETLPEQPTMNDVKICSELLSAHPFSSAKSSPTPARPFRCMLSVTLTGGLTTTRACTGSLTQDGTEAAVTLVQLASKALPVKVTGPSGRPVST